MPIALDGIRTCISGIRAHSASDRTTTAGTSRVSRMKHFRHSPVSSIAKQSCMKDSNSYLRDRDAKHLQGPPLSRTKRVCVCVCVCVCVRVYVSVPIIIKSSSTDCPHSLLNVTCRKLSGLVCAVCVTVSCVSVSLCHGTCTVHTSQC